MTKSMKNKQQTVQEKVNLAMEKILPNYPQGIRAGKLEEEILKILDIKNPRHTIGPSISEVTKKYPKQFGKFKERGTFYFLQENLTEKQKSVNKTPTNKSKKSPHKEKDFYDSFAKFLKYNDDQECLNECTKAIALGNKNFKDYWATPDVIGLFEPQRGDAIQFTTEIISAEIKNDSTPMVQMTAFGQACAYRLFSHKTYLVVPVSADTDRLVQICRVLGIGLVYFDATVKKIDISIFKVKLMAQKHEPDMFYVNKYIDHKLIKEIEKNG